MSQHRRSGPLHALRTTWTRTDTALVVVITLAGGALRLWRLRVPRGIVFDEFYAVDACRYLHGLARRCDVAGIPSELEISIAHPPLGKWLLAAGIRVFGFSPGGWRVAPLVAGTLTIALVYLLARRLLGSTLGAALAATLVSLDLLHFVFSRTAMLDVFVVLFVTAAVLFAVYDRSVPIRPVTTGAVAAVYRHRWRLAAGAAVGAAAACKWSGWFILPVVAALVAEPHLRRGGGAGDARRVIGPLASIVLAMVVVPLTIYTLTFVGRVDGSVLASPWADDSWASGFVDRQRSILDSHRNVQGGHPYQSRGWSWPLLKRPVSLSFAEGSDGRYAEVLAVGNPVVWWPGMVAVGYCAVRAARRRTRRVGDVVVVTAFASVYGPWLISGRGAGQDFLYYFLPAVPFLCLALAVAGTDLRRTAAGGAGVGLFILASIGSFAFFHPVLSAQPLEYDDWRVRMVFRDCPARAGPPGAPPDRRLRPTAQLGPPPKGWCWV